MATRAQRSRQQRALAQRQREFERYSKGKMKETGTGTFRNFTDPEDKANKASRDVTALKAKLGVVAQEDS